jgi:hypothetical protein
MTKLALLLTLTATAGFAAEPPPLELDHVTIVVPPGAAGVTTALAAAGFRFLSPEPTVQRGRGTATRTLGFENAYLELLWVTDRDELLAADPELGPRLKWDDAGTSRIGFALRRRAPGDSLPFPTREHGGTLFAKTANHEPFVSVVAADHAWPLTAAGLTAELLHPNGSRRVTDVRWVHRKRGGNTPAWDYVTGREIVLGGLAGGDPYVEIELDDGRTGKRVDLRPGLPLVFRF